MLEADPARCQQLAEQAYHGKLIQESPCACLTEFVECDGESADLHAATETFTTASPRPLPKHHAFSGQGVTRLVRWGLGLAALAGQPGAAGACRGDRGPTVPPGAIESFLRPAGGIQFCQGNPADPGSSLHALPRPAGAEPAGAFRRQPPGGPSAIVPKLNTFRRSGWLPAGVQPAGRRGAGWRRRSPVERRLFGAYPERPRGLAQCPVRALDAAALSCRGRQEPAACPAGGRSLRPQGRSLGKWRGLPAGSTCSCPIAATIRKPGLARMRSTSRRWRNAEACSSLRETASSNSCPASRPWLTKVTRS